MPNVRISRYECTRRVFTKKESSHTLCPVSLVITYYPKTMNKRQSSNEQELVQEKNLIHRNAKFASWK